MCGEAPIVVVGQSREGGRSGFEGIVSRTAMDSFESLSVRRLGSIRRRLAVGINAAHAPE